MTMARAHWTLLIYMAADSPGLFGPTEAILDEMTEAPSNDQVKVVVERITASGSSRMQIVHHERKILDTFADENTGRPKTLTRFLKWGARRYPAKRTAVIIFGHGSGIDDWSPVIPDAVRGPGKRSRPVRDSIALTQTYLDYLTTEGLRKAVSDADLDVALIGLDACLMGMVEVEIGRAHV